MIDINSNCARVDFVKALASQLKVQAAQPSHGSKPDEGYQKLKMKLEAVDQAVKSGDPQKAEQALSAAESAAKDMRNVAGTSPDKSKSVDIYA